MSNTKVSGGYAVGFCLAVLFWMFVALPLTVMFAWNALVPAVFHGPTINFGESLAIIVLVGVLRGIASGSKS